MSTTSFTHNDLNDARVTVTVFSATVAIVLAVIYSVVRLKFGELDLLAVLKTLSLSVFLVSLSQSRSFFPERFRSRYEHSWCMTDGFFVFAGVLVLALAGRLFPLTHVNLLPVFALLGTALFLKACVLFWRGGTIKQNVCFLAIPGVLFSLWTAGITWGSNYLHPLFLERILIGKAHIDTLFHASIAGMLTTYGIPSTGLDGLPAVSYHYGSHWIFARLSDLSGMAPLRFYQLGFPVIFLPLWFYCLLTFVIQLRSSLPSSSLRWNLRTDRWFWLLILGAQVGFLPEKTASAMAFWKSFFLSESYVSAVSCSFIFLSLVLSFCTEKRGLKCSTWNDRILLLLIFPLLLGSIGFLKISLLYLLFALYCYMFLRLRLYRHAVCILSFTGSFLTCLVVYKATSPQFGRQQTFSLFFFLKEYIAAPLRLFFFIFFFFWVWFFIFVKFRVQGIRTLADLRDAVRRKRILDVESLGAICFAGVLPGIFLAYIKANAWYFSDFQRWLGLSLVLAHLGVFKAMFGSEHRGRGFWNLKISSLILMTPLLIFLAANWGSIVKRIPFSNQDLRAGIVDPQNTPKARILDALGELETLSRAEKKTSLLFIPRSNTGYWSLLKDCEDRPFIAPALTGIAMLEGTPDASCAPAGYGYPHYTLTAIHQSAEDLKEETLCAKALKKGFSRVIVVNGNETQDHARVEKISCQ